MSSTLTIALASLGGVVLAGLVAHGAWQARKAGPKKAEAEPEQPPRLEPRTDPAMGSGPEPGDFRSGATAGLGAATPERPETGEPALQIEPSFRAPRRATLRIDALIDAIATLRVEAPIAGALALPHLPPSRRAGGKPFLIEGLNSETGEWEAPLATQRYGEFQAGVQMANRTGALNEIEYSEFVQKVQAFADAIGAMPDFPDMLEAVAAARELDGFAGEHDAQLAVRLRASHAAWSVGYIQQHAGRHGFVPGVVPGRLVLPSADEGAPPVLMLTFDSQAAFADDPNLAAVRDVTLSFDVPQTDASVQPFGTWQTSAEALARDMGADIVDDAGNPISAAGFAAIGGALDQLYGTLDARDLAAGTPAARRLFS